MEVLAQLEEAVDAAARLDLDAWAMPEVQELAVALERAAGRLRGIASLALGIITTTLSDPDGDLDPADPDAGSAASEGTRAVAWWWRDSLGLTGEAAGRAVRRSRALTALPIISAAVVDGQLSLEQAGAMTPLVGKLPEHELHDMQPMLLEGCRGRTTDSISHWVRTLIAQHCEPAHDLAQDHAEQARMLKYRLGSDGTLRGRFVLPAGRAEGLLTALEALARREGQADTRHAGQRRADALLDIGDLAARHGDLPHTGGQRAHVSYVLPADWAARRAARTAETWNAGPARTRAAASTGAADGAASGAWTGPATRGHLEAILCDARISRVLLDSTGQVHSLETLTDQITLAQRRAIAARDQHCTGPGCSRPSAYCDVHHLLARKDGGPTTLENLALLCRRHHTLWHLGKLQVHDLRLPWLDPPQAA